MGVILGTMTRVIVDGQDSGFQSINWGINSQPNRLWQLGAWEPWKTQVVKTVSVSLTTYAGVLSPVNLQPSTSCTDSTALKNITIDASACDPALSINQTFNRMFITSYSYSKTEPTGYGTESWSFQAWVDADTTGTDFINIPEPTAVLQGISEGQKSGDVVNIGVEFLTAGQVTGSQGSVSAGTPGIGNTDTITLGIVSRIGGGDLEAFGKTGSSSASIPHTPIYIG